jgi:hypothetical protein
MIFKTKHTRSFFILFIISFLALPIIVFGRIGVGIGTGKIQIDKSLKAGDVYSLEFSVLNTGDEPGEYGVSVEYQEDIPQISPSREWFHFNPQSFDLGPGKSQLIKTTITIPDKIRPGEYFAYLEGRPVKKSIDGQTSIGVAAATKLYFTIDPVNIFQKIYYQFIDTYNDYHPLDTIILLMIIVIIILFSAKKHFDFKIIKK